ncbi:hypothetical protein AAFF_G00166350 [Aldrovandia affinis]|uniref:Uncharacterized protein n=1 Tax=Aldrovandia affinis TaxID=143900 RepID=A0AAD7RMM1_9TELE|nr:hypothetical protein AAFF_G00166350 [Aldrovandia affinis]
MHALKPNYGSVKSSRYFSRRTECARRGKCQDLSRVVTLSRRRGAETGSSHFHLDRSCIAKGLKPQQQGFRGHIPFITEYNLPAPVHPYSEGFKLRQARGSLFPLLGTADLSVG